MMLSFIYRLTERSNIIRSKADAELLRTLIPNHKKFYFDNGRYITNKTTTDLIWFHRKGINQQLKILKAGNSK